MCLEPRREIDNHGTPSHDKAAKNTNKTGGHPHDKYETPPITNTEPLPSRHKHNKHQADTYTYVSAMKAVGAAGQWEVAVSLLGELRDLEGVAPDVYVYTAAIAACSTAGR